VIHPPVRKTVGGGAGRRAGFFLSARKGFEEFQTRGWDRPPDFGLLSARRESLRSKTSGHLPGWVRFREEPAPRPSGSACCRYRKCPEVLYCKVFGQVSRNANVLPSQEKSAHQPGLMMCRYTRPSVEMMLSGRMRDCPSMKSPAVWWCPQQTKGGRSASTISASGRRG
jgi:hypothetical protein